MQPPFELKFLDILLLFFITYLIFFSTTIKINNKLCFESPLLKINHYTTAFGRLSELCQFIEELNTKG